VTDRPPSFAVDAADRIVQTCDDPDGMAAFLGHPLWEYLPHAEPALRPFFDEARRSGETVEAAIFYAGRLVEARIVPCGQFLTVHVTRRAALDLSSLRTLAASLSSIEEELAARSPSRRDRPTLVSRRALL
jgi:hypothetical protein